MIVNFVAHKILLKYGKNLPLFFAKFCPLFLSGLCFFASIKSKKKLTKNVNFLPAAHALHFTLKSHFNSSFQSNATANDFWRLIFVTDVINQTFLMRNFINILWNIFDEEFYQYILSPQFSKAICARVLIAPNVGPRGGIFTRFRVFKFRSSSCCLAFFPR